MPVLCIFATAHLSFVDDTPILLGPPTSPHPTRPSQSTSTSMLAARTPVSLSLHHRIVAGGHRGRCVGGSQRRRGGAPCRQFTQALQSLWRHSPPIPPPAPPAAGTATSGEAEPSRQPPVLENAAFEEYYKVWCPFRFRIAFSLSIALAGAIWSEFRLQSLVTACLLRLELFRCCNNDKCVHI